MYYKKCKRCGELYIRTKCFHCGKPDDFYVLTEEDGEDTEHPSVNISEVEYDEGVR